MGVTGVQEVGMVGCTVVPRDAEHDVLCAMEQRIEQGIAPERMLGTHFKFEGGDPKNPENYHSAENTEGYI